ncbi:methyltransferase domain-containing protein [Endothiovibrio diazotrophicus]
MDSASEGNRLEGKTDPVEMVRQLRLVGLAPGMRALDAGAGTGAVARVMAELVGPTGKVTALDASAQRMEQGQRLAAEEGVANLDFITGNLLAPPVPKGSFDFIWSRFVFEYLSDADGEHAIAQLTDRLAPGGILAIADLDGNMLFHDGLDPKLEDNLNRIIVGLGESFDPYVGRKLYGRFYRQGLKDIQVHCMPYHLFAGQASEKDIENWKAKFVTTRDYGVDILGSERSYEVFVANFLDFLRRDDTLTYSTLFLVSGKKPV